MLLFTVEVLIPFGMISESKKIVKFCSESFFFLVIYSVSPIASASANTISYILSVQGLQMVCSPF
jgi:hypothetical protein